MNYRKFVESLDDSELERLSREIKATQQERQIIKNPGLNLREMELVEQGKLGYAIKAYRERTGATLQAALGRVNDYRTKSKFSE